MPRQKSNGVAKNGKAPMPDLNVSIGEVTKAAFPEGTPENEDGSVASDGEITIQQARKVGALTGESAKYNKDLAKKTKAKMAGETVRWDEKDAINLFDSIKSMFSSSAVHLYVKRTSPDPPIDYRPIPMLSLKNSQDFYDYVLRNIHKESPSARYLITFKNSAQKAGEAYLEMPDTMGDQSARANEIMSHQAPPHFVPYSQGYPPMPGFQPASGFQQPYPYQPPPPQYQQPVPQPASAPVVATVAEPIQHQPAATPAMPAGVDPAVMGMFQTMFQEVRAGQELMRNMQMQTAQMMGEFTELRRQQDMAPAYPPSPPAPAFPQAPIFQAPVPQPMPSPQGYRPAAGKFDPFRGGIPTPPGYQAVFSHAPLPGGLPIDDLPGWWWIPTTAPQPAPTAQSQYQVPTGTGYPQPPGYPMPPGYQQQQPQYPASPYPQPAPVAANPMSGLDASVSTLVGAMKSIDRFREVVSGFNGGGNASEPGDFEDSVEIPNPVTPPPVSTMPLPGGAMVAFNPDGSPHWATTLIGNIPKITDFVNSLGNTAANIHRAQQEARAPVPPQHVDRIVLPPPAPPPQAAVYHPALPQHRPVPHPMATPPQAAPPQPPQQATQNSFLPNAAALRSQP